jgi:tape measure domain-containing protein
VVDKVVIKIMAQDLASGTIKGVGSALKGMGKATAAPVKGLGSLGKGLGKISGGVKGAVGSIFSLQGAIVGIGLKLVSSKIVRYADAWTTTANKLKLVQKEGQTVINTQEKLFKLAQESRGPLGSVSSLYSRIARSTEELGLEQQELLDVTETISKAFTVSGAGATEMDAAILQLGQGLASGVLRGEELNSVMEQAPRLARAIADGMEIPFGQLRKMSSEGKVTSAVLIKALQSQGDVIRAEFEMIEPTVGSLMTNIDNAFQRMVGLFNEQVGFTKPIKDALEFIVDMFAVTIPAAMMMIPRVIEFTAKTFGVLKDIALSVWKQITDDPIEMLSRLFTYMVENFANGVGFMIKAGALLWEQYIDTGIATLKFLNTLIIDNFTFAWETVKAAFFRFVVNPVIGGFKIIMVNVAEAIDRFAPETAGKLRKALLSINKVGGDVFPKIPEDVAKSFDDIVTSISNGEERLGALGTAFMELLGDQAGSVSTLLGLTDEQLAAISGLGIDLQSMWGDAKQAIIDANAAAGKVPVVTEAAAASIVTQQPIMVRAWQAVSAAVDHLATESMKGAVAGVKEYEESLGSIASNVQSAVTDSLKKLEGGVSSGFDALLFGGGAAKAAGKVAKDLKPIAAMIRDTFNAEMTDPRRAQTAGGVAAMIDTALEGRNVSGSLKRRAEEIRNSVALIGQGDVTAEGVAGDIERLVKQLEAEGGLMNRVKDFGAGIKTSLVTGFQDSTVQLFTKATMAGFLQFGAGVLGALTGKGEDMAANTKTGMVTKWGIDAFGFIHETLSTAVGTFAKPLKAVGTTIFGDMHDGGETTWAGKPFKFIWDTLKTAVDGFTGMFKERGNDIAEDMNTGVDERWNKKGFDFINTGLDGKVRNMGMEFKDTGYGIGDKLESGVSGRWGIKDFNFIKDRPATQVDSFADSFKTSGGNAADSIESGMGTTWGIKDLDFLKDRTATRVGAFNTDFMDSGGVASDSIASGMGLNWGAEDFNFLDGDVSRRIGVRSGEYDASGRKISTSIGGGIRADFRNTDYTSEFPSEVDKNTSSNADDLEKSGLTIGQRLGKGLGQGFSAYIAGTAFAAILNELTGIDLPKPLLKGIAIAEGVAGMFGVSLAGKLKTALFGTTGADGKSTGGALTKMFGEGGIGLGGALAIGAGIAFMEIFVPSARKAISSLMQGDMMGVINNSLKSADEMFKVVKDISGGLIDIDLNLGGIFGGGRSKELKTFQSTQSGLKKVRGEGQFSTEEIFEKALSSGNVGLLSLAASSGNLANVQALSERVELAFGNEIATVFSELIKSLASGDSGKSDKLAGALGKVIEAQGGVEGVAKSLGIGKSSLTGQTFADAIAASSTSTAAAEEQAVHANEGTSSAGPQAIIDFLGGVFLNRGGKRSDFRSLGQQFDLPTIRGIVGSSRWDAMDPTNSLESGFLDLFQGGSPDMTPFRTFRARGGQQGTPISITARHGARVPGPPSRPVGAIVHGGERIMSVKEQDQMGGTSVNVTFVINGNGDAEIQRMLDQAMPQIQRSVENGLTQKSRFGQFQLDSRAVRTVLTN